MSDLEQTRAMWDAVAADWQLQVGDTGDANRRLNSDPVLWEFLGDVTDLDVLDAGCGTGYLSLRRSFRSDDRNRAVAWSKYDLLSGRFLPIPRYSKRWFF